LNEQQDPVLATVSVKVGFYTLLAVTEAIMEYTGWCNKRNF